MLSAKYLYSGDQYMSIERDPPGFQGSAGRIDASAVLASQAGDPPWTLALKGEAYVPDAIVDRGGGAVAQGPL